MRKVVLFLVLALLVPVVASAVPPYVSIDQRLLMCGSGTVRVQGYFDVGDGYNRLFVMFGPQYGTINMVLDRPGLANGQYQEWKVDVPVTQGQQYYFDVRLWNASLNKTVMRAFDHYVVPACDDAKLQALIDLAVDRMAQP